MESSFSFLVEATGERLDLFLSRQTGQSRRFVKSQIESGRIRVNDATIEKAAQRLKAGDKITGGFEEEYRLDLTPIAYDLAIVFEDEHFLLLNKPPGVVVHPAVGHRGETLVHYLLHHLQNHSEFTATSETRPGIVHRLDRGTSGLILVAKHRRALENLSAQFKSRAIKKEYESVSWGKLKPEGIFQSSIGRDPKDRKRMSSKSENGREAVTRFAVMSSFAHFSHVRLMPHTGRTHQLRVHLSEAGHPIVGDPMYGTSSVSRRKSLLAPAVRHAVEGLTHTLLHARSLELSHPITGAPLSFTAERPQIFDDFLACLKEHDR